MPTGANSREAERRYILMVLAPMVVGIVVFTALSFVGVAGNKPPVASFSYSPLSPTTADTIQFTDTSSDEDGQVVSWLWNFGDGVTSTERDPAHQFITPRNYTVTLTVTDDDGSTDSCDKEVTVTPSEIMFQDFDDATLGSNFPDTSAGMMSENGDYDPAYEFVQVNSGYALKLTFDFPENSWCGYWSFLIPSGAPEGYDLSGYNTLKMKVKGEPGEGSVVRFKVEINDTVFDPSNYEATQTHRGMVSKEASISWGEIEIFFSEFTSSGPDLDFSDIKQLNIVFDQTPRQGSLYIDWIAFT